MSAEPIRVLLIDDDELMRTGLTAALTGDPAIEVVGQASTVHGADALEREAAVIILTTFEQDHYIIDAGASGFLLKRTRPEALHSAIHAVAAGASLLSPSVTRIVLEHLARQPAPRPESAGQPAEPTPVSTRSSSPTRPVSPRPARDPRPNPTTAITHRATIQRARADTRARLLPALDRVNHRR